MRPIANIEIGALPLVGRLHAGNLDEINTFSRGDRGGTTLYHGFFREIRTLDSLSPKGVVSHPVVESWPKAEIGLEQANVSGKEDRDVRREMMGLQPKEIKERSKEIARRKP